MSDEGSGDLEPPWTTLFSSDGLWAPFWDFFFHGLLSSRPLPPLSLPSNTPPTLSGEFLYERPLPSRVHRDRSGIPGHSGMHRTTISPSPKDVSPSLLPADRGVGELPHDRASEDAYLMRLCAYVCIFTSTTPSVATIIITIVIIAYLMTRRLQHLVLTPICPTQEEPDLPLSLAEL